MALARPCATCGTPVLKGNRCPTHQREARREQNQRKTSNAIHKSGRWKREARQWLHDWIAEHGAICIGYADQPAHISTDLTVDHDRPITSGHDPWDKTNWRSRCRRCNGRKAAREEER